MRKKVLLIILLGILFLGVTGCGVAKKAKTTQNVKQQVEKKSEKKEEINLVGTYSLIEMNSGDQTYSESDLNMLKEKGLTVTLVLKDDKTATLDIFGTQQELKYDDKYFYSDGEKIPFTFKEGTMKLSNETQSLTFRLDK